MRKTAANSEKWPQCPKCKVQLKPGIAMYQTWVAGIPDFIGDRTDTRCQTLHTGGSGKIGQCLKCPECGYSVTDCVGFDPAEHRTDGCDLFEIYQKQYPKFYALEPDKEIKYAIW